MQKSKHNRKFRRRVVSLLTLVLILMIHVALLLSTIPWERMADAYLALPAS